MDPCLFCESNDDNYTFVTNVHVDRRWVCFSKNTATNSRCLAVAVASVFQKQKEERVKKRGRCNTEMLKP